MRPQKEISDKISVHHMAWRGTQIEITFDPDWLNGSSRNPEYAFERLQVQSTAPERAPLPITETGYKSHFIPAGSTDAYGGPIAYVEAWLDHEANSAEWIEQEAKSRQMSLF